MTEPATAAAGAADARRAGIAEVVAAKIGRRRAAERRFKLYGIIAICFALGMLAVLVMDIVLKGYTAFVQTHVQLEIEFKKDEIDPEDKLAKARAIADPEKRAAALAKATTEVLQDANYVGLIRAALRKKFPGVTGRQNLRQLYKLVSNNADRALRDAIAANAAVIGQKRTIWLLAHTDIDMLEKGEWKFDPKLGDGDQVIKKLQYDAYAQLKKEGRLETHFNLGFFTNSNSSEPEAAGILGALMGSLWTMLVTLLIAFPIGVAASVYLEEFAPKNRFTDLVEVNINNLAAVPSIVFGLLGLAVFIGFFGLPRSTPLVGGMVLALMTLPTIIISARAALKAVPPSVREAALGVGASKMQTVTHHVLPLAMPGILTGTIIGMAQALGETAPLLMVGMNAFVADVPGSVVDGAAVMPTQIFEWANKAERGFEERTAAAILVLLTFLVIMNAAAVYLRKKFERRW
jgi:phosphate transport system permease protein